MDLRRVVVSFTNEAWVRRGNEGAHPLFWHCLVGAAVSLCVNEECRVTCLTVGLHDILEKPFVWGYG